MVGLLSGSFPLEQSWRLCNNSSYPVAPGGISEVTLWPRTQRRTQVASTVTRLEDVLDYSVQGPTDFIT